MNRWCRECTACSRGKTTRQHESTATPIAIPARRFSHVHMDLVGPLPQSAAGHSYLFTMIDRSTRWLEATPVMSIEASTCADAFIVDWVSRFGVPATVTSDGGRQFTSVVWEAICKKLGVHPVATTAYHPQSNGMIERAHRQLKDALRSRLAGEKWVSHLPWVLLGLRAVPGRAGVWLPCYGTGPVPRHTRAAGSRVHGGASVHPIATHPPPIVRVRGSSTAPCNHEVEFCIY